VNGYKKDLPRMKVTLWSARRSMLPTSAKLLTSLMTPVGGGGGGGGCGGRGGRELSQSRDATKRHKVK
jgi:hypothetical protein